LIGRRATADRDAARLERFGNDALQADMQKPVLEVRALHYDVVGEHEATLESAARNATIEQLRLRVVVLHAAGDDQRVVLGDHIEVVGTEARHRHRQAVGVLTGLLNIVRRIGSLGRCRGAVYQVSETIETDRRTK